MKLSEIHDEVVTKLNTPKGVLLIAKRRNAISKLSKALQEIAKVEMPLLKSRNAWFSTNQTLATTTRGGARLQQLGVDVGYLALEKNPKHAAPTYVFHPNPKTFPENKELPSISWAWSNSKKDANEIRKYLNLCAKKRGNKAPQEREIQWQLASLLRSEKTPDSLSALKHLNVVTWNTHPTEIGVSISRTGSLGVGNIDLMVRRGKGAQRGFLVFEIKAPGEKGLESALLQASRYATALHIEANHGSPSELSAYRTILGTGDAKTLPIGAVAVLEDDDKGIVRKKAQDILSRFYADKGDSTVDRLGLLLYKFSKTDNSVTSWSWFSTEWDPRSSSKTNGVG